MSFVIIATIVVFLFIKKCAVTTDEWSFREMEDRAFIVEEEAFVTTVANGGNLVKATDKAPAPQQTDHVEKNAGNSATLLSMQAKAAFETGQAEAPPGLAGKAKPDTSRDAPGAGISGSQQNLAPIVVAAVHRPIAVASATLPGDAVSTDTTTAQDRQETILISFPFDSDDLIPDSHLALDRAVTMLRGNTLSTASITGFTDNKGDSQYNLILSRKRASAVEQYLVNAGIARDRLRVEGRGVLTEPVEGQIAGAQDAAEPYRIVRIKLGIDG